MGGQQENVANELCEQKENLGELGFWELCKLWRMTHPAVRDPGWSSGMPAAQALPVHPTPQRCTPSHDLVS